MGSAWLLGLGLRGPSARSLGQSPSLPGRVVTSCCWLCCNWCMPDGRGWRPWEPAGPGGCAWSLGGGRAPRPRPFLGHV